MSERPVYRSAVPLSFGVAMIGVGAFLEWSSPAAWDIAAAAPFGIGLFYLSLGVYRLADNLDRAAKTIIERDRPRA